MRLSEAALDQLADGVQRPRYDRAAQRTGIVHFGIGAFHRAHQAWYTDLAMDGGDRDWATIGVSLRSGDVAEQLNPQDGLYTVTERSADGFATRLVGAVREVLVAPQDPAAVIAALALPSVHIASLTITEKGYCRTPDGALDLAAADEGSIFNFLAQGLRHRHNAGLPGLTLLSCDNLADNGHQLAQLMRECLAARDPALLPWFEAECTCPSTMVDRIVPATTNDDRGALEGRIGLADQAAVMTEPFSQWVIEDRFAGPRPRWEAVGAQLVADVRPYEMAKLRMLNGAHSMLAYVGLAHGRRFVHEAIADPAIRALAEQLMQGEAMPTLIAAPGQDLAAYADALLARFANPALQHRLIQIAMDGSQKLPQRWLDTLADNQRMGRSCQAILAGIAGWIHHLSGANGVVDDPRGVELAHAATGDDPVGALFGPGGLLPSRWVPTESDRAAIVARLAAGQP